MRFGALRPGARGRVGRVARLVYMGSIEVCENPVWNTTINWDQLGGTAGERWAIRDGVGLLSEVKAPSPAFIRCPWSDPSL